MGVGGLGLWLNFVCEAVDRHSGCQVPCCWLTVPDVPSTLRPRPLLLVVQRTASTAEFEYVVGGLYSYMVRANAKDIWGHHIKNICISSPFTPCSLKDPWSKSELAAKASPLNGWMLIRRLTQSLGSTC